MGTIENAVKNEKNFMPSTINSALAINPHLKSV